jgi:biotin transport system substrate-specific component
MTTTGAPLAGTLVERLVPARGPLARPVVRDSLLVLAGTLLMALCARISVPVPWSDVPLTFQTFGVYLIGALFGPRLAVLTMLAYIGTGMLGMPVFSFGRSAWAPTLPGSPFAGIPLIIGPTAGYLLSFPLAAAVVGALARRGWDRRIRTALPAMIAGAAVVLTCGVLWRVAAGAVVGLPLELSALLVSSVVGFLPGEAVKVLLAAVALPGAWKLVGPAEE